MMTHFVLQKDIPKWSTLKHKAGSAKESNLLSVAPTEEKSGSKLVESELALSNTYYYDVVGR